MIDEEKLRDALKQVGINYDDYKGDGLALLDAIAAKWNELGQISEDTCVDPQ